MPPQHNLLPLMLLPTHMPEDRDKVVAHGLVRVGLELLGRRGAPEAGQVRHDDAEVEGEEGGDF